MLRSSQLKKWWFKRPEIHNRYLPVWVRRICNGAFGAALFIGLGSIWFEEPADSWRHVLARCMIWSSFPVGIALALLARRFSIVEGVAGGEGYDELHKRDDEKHLA